MQVPCRCLHCRCLNECIAYQVQRSSPVDLGGPLMPLLARLHCEGMRRIRSCCREERSVKRQQRRRILYKQGAIVPQLSTTRTSQHIPQARYHSCWHGSIEGYLAATSRCPEAAKDKPDESGHQRSLPISRVARTYRAEGVMSPKLLEVMPGRCPACTCRPFRCPRSMTIRHGSLAHLHHGLHLQCTWRSLHSLSAHHSPMSSRRLGPQ